MKHTLILVGADKGGVGKTTTSRALLDFLARKNIMARAFDTENPRGTLHRFYPGITEIIDLNNVADQMKLLDTIETAPVKVSVVDLKAGNLLTALDIFSRIGVLDAAAAGDFNLALVHVVGPAIASLDEMGEVTKYTKNMSYVVAKNFINETNFFEWDNRTYQKYFAKLADAPETQRDGLRAGRSGRGNLFRFCRQPQRQGGRGQVFVCPQGLCAQVDKRS